MTDMAYGPQCHIAWSVHAIWIWLSGRPGEPRSFIAAGLFDSETKPMFLFNAQRELMLKIQCDYVWRKNTGEDVRPCSCKLCATKRKRGDA